MTDGLVAPAPPALEVPDLDLDGVRLSALTEADAPDLLARTVGDEEIRRWSSVGQVTDLASAEAWARSRAAVDRLEWSIRLADGALAGRVALHGVDLEDGVAEVGYGLFADYRGRGLARLVVRRVVAYGFADLSLHRIELLHALGNTRSCGVAEACGFLLEGTLRQVLDDRAGGWEDAHLHSRLSTD